MYILEPLLTIYCGQIFVMCLLLIFSTKANPIFETKHSFIMWIIPYYWVYIIIKLLIQNFKDLK